MKTRTKVAGLVAGLAMLSYGIFATVETDNRSGELRSDPVVVEHSKLESYLETPVIKSVLYSSKNPEEEQENLRVKKERYDSLDSEASVKNDERETLPHYVIPIVSILIGGLGSIYGFGKSLFFPRRENREENPDMGGHISA